MSESVPPVPSQILYNNTSGQTAGNKNLTLDTTYNGTRLESRNLLVNNATNLVGNVGIYTATPRQALEVTGNTILTAQGTNSQAVNEFGLNGKYDTLSLISPVGLGLNGTTSIFFGLNSVIYYPVARIVAKDNGNYSGSMAFQIGNGNKLYEQMRLTTNGIYTANAAFIYTTRTLPTPGTNLCLNFPSVSNGTMSIIDIYVNLQKETDSSFINMVKFTAFLGSQLYVTGISVQAIGASAVIIGPNSVSANGSKITIKYSDTVNAYNATVNYMIYGPASGFISSVDITLNDSGITTVPGIPTGYTTNPGNQSVFLNWSAPADGGSLLTGYTISDGTGSSLTASGSIDASGNYSGGLVSDAGSTLLITSATVIANTAATITGLTNGTSYTFSIKAKNAIGYSGTSSLTVTPAIVPGAPTNVIATVGSLIGSQSASLTWTPPLSTGGSPITSYLVVSNPSAVSIISSPGQVITGLTNGTSYTFQVYARNIIGESVASSPSNSVSSSSSPDQPVITGVSGGVGSATISWTAPASNGSAITSYKIISNPVSSTTTVSGSLTTATVTGLSAGTFYTFTVTATSVNGDSLPSNPSSAVSTFAAPGAPTITTASEGVKSVTLTWSPGSTGGSPITGYRVYDSSNNLVYDGSGNLAVTATISGLSDGTPYVFTVRALNLAGASDASSASLSVTTFSVPSAPAIGTATPGVNSITVTWTTPTSTGGSPITKYTLYGPSSYTQDASGNTATITGLANGTTYAYTVKAYNAVGYSLASGSVSATTFDFPGIPTGLTSVSGTEAVTLTWTEPVNTGGTPLTGYKIYDSSGNVYNSTTNTFVSDSSGTILTITGATTIILTGLTNGTTYIFTIKSVNIVGNSQTAATFPSVVPGLPDPPTGLSAISGTGNVILSWIAPTSIGGSPITTYKVYDGSGSFVFDSSGNLSATITGLTNGSLYTYVVKAFNANGSSLESISVQVTVGFPGTPTQFTATAGNLSAVLNWVAPSGSPTGYKLYDPSGNILNSSGNFVADTGAIITTTSTTVTITGLQNGQQYTYGLFAVNTFGISSVAAYISVRPGLPNPPTALSGSSGNGTVSLNWTAPSVNGGSAITGYSIVYSGITITSTTPYTVINGLTNGTLYTFAVFSVNANGISIGSVSTSLTPYTVPEAPFGLSVTSTSTTATLTWLTPSANGSSITGYKLYDSSGNISDSSGNFAADTGVVITTSSNSFTIESLTTGQTYVYTVKATNSAGNSLGTSISVTPGVPGTPVSLTGIPGNLQVTLNWSAPSGSVTGYTISYSGITVSVSSSTFSRVVTGLTNGAGYTFSVVAINANGSSIPAVITLTPGLPDAPTGLTASAGSGSVTLNWTAPSANGGSAITGYLVTYSSTGAITTVSPSPTTTTTRVSGLTTGTTYTFTVKTQNANGNSVGGVSISVIPG